jgi:putative endonuclease
VLFKPVPLKAKRLHLKGKQGEQRAASYLQGLGHFILHTNWRAGRLAEVDLISWNPFTNTYHFIEVKTRSTARASDATEQATLKKLNKLQLGVQHYLMQKQLPLETTPVQLDWVVVLFDKRTQEHKLLYYPNITG